MLALITTEPIDEPSVHNSVLTPTAGALVTFSGIVRDHDEGRGVLSLDYQAHPEAERMLRECCERIAAESGLAVAAVHRVGALKLGDVALSAAVASAHRREAFETCARLIDEIKLTVPIWKRQHYSEGSSDWVGL